MKVFWTKNVEENIFSVTLKFVSVHWLHNNLLNSQSNFQCINKPRPCQIYHEMKSQRTRNYFETQILIKNFFCPYIPIDLVDNSPFLFDIHKGT